MARTARSPRSAVPPAPTLPADEVNRRGELVRAAGRLFREKGYAATTIRDIAGAVNMRSGSPFYHFKTKHDILCAVVLEGIGTIHAAVAAVAARDLPPRERFEAMLAAHLEVLLGAAGRDFAATLLHESRHLDPAEQAEVTRLKDAYEALWQQALKDLRKAGLLDDDSAVTRLFLMGAMNWTTLWFRPEGRATPKSLARQLAALILR
jgi:TetR/AcrR family transcriptional regulator, cholesterol catabolism regulator